jgi:acetyl-CoA decarbonylase/synthase complex subunit gamma
MSILSMLAWFLISGAVSSYLSMNFTGASTYTSLSGVRKEMRIFVPIQIAFAIAGLVLLIISKFI